MTEQSLEEKITSIVTQHLTNCRLDMQIQLGQISNECQNQFNVHSQSITKLEERSSHTASRLDSIDKSVAGIFSRINDLAKETREQMQGMARDRNRVLVGIVLTIASVFVSRMMG